MNEVPGGTFFFGDRVNKKIENGSLVRYIS